MQAFDLQGVVTALLRDGTSEVIQRSGGPPVRVDGFTVGLVDVTQNPPHRGEVHPDGDEYLLVLSGRAEVIFDDGDQDTVGTETVVTIESGQGIVVPRGVWHRVNVIEPYRLVHITPGPGDGHRPL